MRTWIALPFVLVFAGASLGQPKAAPVPPMLEIEVLDPNVDPQGLPTVMTRNGFPGEMQIEIPQTILVHRYYYTGDRTFQARMLPGGPCIVVVHHPRTGERLYVPVQMAPGAPKVIYTNHAIEYDFGFQTITIRFCLIGRPEVVYSHGQPFGRGFAKHAHASIEQTKALIERTGIPNATRKTVQVGKNITGTGVDNLREVGKAVVSPLQQVIQLIPGVTALTSSPEAQAESVRNVQIQRAVDQQKLLEGSLRTNR